MTATSLEATPAVWNCRWSRPGYRVTGVPDELQPEPLWVCIRTGDRQGVPEEACESCPHREREPRQTH